MSAAIAFDNARAAWVIEGADGEDRFRLIVPNDFIGEELGADAPEDARRDWIDANLPQILSTYKARTDGGWVKAPWNRILVEEIN